MQKEKTLANFEKNVVPFLCTFPWNSDAAASISNLIWQHFFFVCNLAEVKDRKMQFFTCAVT